MHEPKDMSAVANVLVDIAASLDAIGIRLEHCPRGKNFKVISVAEDSPSGRGQRIVVGDIVTEFNGEQIHSLNQSPAVPKRSLRRGEAKFTFLRVHKSPDYAAVDIAIPRYDSVASESSARPPLVFDQNNSDPPQNPSLISNSDTVSAVSAEPEGIPPRDEPPPHPQSNESAPPSHSAVSLPPRNEITIANGELTQAPTTSLCIDKINIPPLARPDYLTTLLRKSNELSRELSDAKDTIKTLEREKEQLQEELEKMRFLLAEKEASASEPTFEQQDATREISNVYEQLEAPGGAVFEEASYISDMDSDFGSVYSGRSGPRNGGKVVDELRCELQRTRNRLQESLIHSGLWDFEDARSVRASSYHQAMDEAFETATLNMLAVKPDFEQKICLDALSMLLSWCYRPWASHCLLRNVAGGMRILARSEVNKEGLLEVGCVDAMLFLIKSGLEGGGHLDAVEHASACLSNLALKHGPAKERIFHSGGVGLLNRLLQHEEWGGSMKAKACSTLSHLACAAAIKKSMMREGCVEALLFVCSTSGEEDLLTEAVRALRNLASRCDTGCVHILSVGGIDVLAGLCMHSRSEKVVRNAAAALSNLASNETCRAECKKKFRWDSDFGTRMVARLQRELQKEAVQTSRALKSALSSRRGSSSSSHQTPRSCTAMSHEHAFSAPRRVAFAGDTIDPHPRRPSSARSMPVAVDARISPAPGQLARPRSAAGSSKGTWDSTKRALSFPAHARTEL